MHIEKYLESISSFKNKKVLLTGATSGIGKELFFHLVKKEADIILFAYEMDIANELKNRYPDRNIDIIYYDQSSFKKIEESIDILLDKYSVVDYFVFNAGVLALKGKTVDGYATTIGINYLGVKHFIEYISPKISFCTRFIIQGSFASIFHLKKNIDFKDESLSTFDQYNASKIYLEAYFYYLYINNKYPNISYVLTEPGLTNTNIISNFNKVIRFLGKHFLKIFCHSPIKASLTLLKAMDKDVNNGDFITPRGLFALGGYPKIKRFPKKRRKEYLFKKEDN